MKSPAPPDHRSFIAGMLASALSITSRLMRHNWRRGGFRADRARQGRYAQRKFPEDDAAASGNRVVLLALLTLVAMLANRETLPFSSLGCVGMYSITNPPSAPAKSTCHAATDRKIDTIKIALAEELAIISEEFSDHDFDDDDGFSFDGATEPTSDDLF
jgi:hypothetical protein